MECLHRRLRCEADSPRLDAKKICTFQGTKITLSSRGYHVPTANPADALGFRQVTFSFSCRASSAFLRSVISRAIAWIATGIPLDMMADPIDSTRTSLPFLVAA